MFFNNRYITRGALETLDQLIIYKIWELLDRFILFNNTNPDYLQIFDLETQIIKNDYILKINHKQEVPKYEHKAMFKLNQKLIINEKVYIISDTDEHGNEYSTMLLASEY